MPYVKVIALKVSSLAPVTRYLVNADADSHEEYSISAPKFIRVADTPTLLMRIKQGFDASNDRYRAGPKALNAGRWWILRLPDGAWLEPAEKAAFEKDFEFWSDGAPSMWVWHDNLLMGSHDLNGVTASFERSGLPHFRREENLIYQARAIADQITDILNIRRRERQLPTIQTMAEVRQERHQDDFDLIVAMASLIRPPKNSQDIEPALLACGCEIIWNRRALIRLLKPGKRRTTLNKEKALEQVKEAREKLQQRDQIIPEKPSPPPSPLDII